jgi:hypothetical protein
MEEQISAREAAVMHIRIPVMTHEPVEYDVSTCFHQQSLTRLLRATISTHSTKQLVLHCRFPS